VEHVGEGWDVPADVKDRVQFHWFHVSPGGALLLVVLSNAPVWYIGHFRQGRMQPCDRNGCESCAAGIGRQVRYVMCAVEVTTHQVGVLEISESVANLVREWSVPHNGSRGLMVELRKATKAKNSRMVVELVKEHPPAWALALQPLDLHEVLSKTWEKIGSK
jgi:hypothetical protein